MIMTNDNIRDRSNELIVWLRHLRAEMRPIRDDTTLSYCDCGNVSRTGTCEECIRKEIKLLENKDEACSKHIKRSASGSTRTI